MNNLKTSRAKKNKLDLLKEKSIVSIFIMPAMLTLALLMVFPFAYGIYISLFKTNLVNKWNFIGIDNYFQILKDSAFYQSMGTTVEFTLLVIAGHLILGLGFALLLNKEIKFRTFYRVILLLPWLFPEVVIANLFRWIFSVTNGLVNGILLNLNLITEPISFLGSYTYAMFVIVLVCIWKGYPMVMLPLIAALQTISIELYEAAKLDGANVFQAFWHITLPGIRPALSVTMLLDTVWWFKHITMIWILTQGGPGEATNVLSVNIYKQAFEYLKFGPASAMAVVVFVICLGIGLIYKRGLKQSD